MGFDKGRVEISCTIRHETTAEDIPIYNTADGVAIIVTHIVGVDDGEDTPGGVGDGDVGDESVGIVCVADAALQRVADGERITGQTVEWIGRTRKVIDSISPHDFATPVYVG